MRFTPEQHEAIYTHDRNVMVVAGAGSGKTWVLVNRYLALLEANPDWSLNALVAITFTQKAAQEMRKRVRQALEQQLAAAPSEDAATVWARRLAAMDSARIDTIHALCASILRANAAEAGVDPAFDVLDETDALILLENVIDDVLRGLVAQRDPTLRLFTEYDSTAVRDTLRDFIAVDLPDLPSDLAGAWRARWEAECSEAIAAFLELAVETWSPVGTDWLSMVWQDCAYCLNHMHEHPGLEQRLDALQSIAALKLVGGTPRAAWGEDGDHARKAITLLREEAKKLLELHTYGELDERAVELLPLWAALLRKVQAAYRQAKADASLLDFDDLEARTRTLLTESPDVRARYLDSEFRHLLVDEFQDTNAAQWDIVRALANPETPGCLFVVGDAKQSIYAFRGADVSVFESVRQRFHDVGGVEVPLVESFRTHETLVNCFNDLFARVLMRGETSPTRNWEIELGAPMRAARRDAPGTSPILEFVLVDKGDEDPRQKRTAEDHRRREAQEIAARVRHMIEVEARTVYDRELDAVRPMHYGDVALLFQSMSSITVYEDVFKSERMPFVTVAGRGYYSRQEVWDLINLLRALYNPSDNLALASILRSPMFNLSDNTLLALRLLYKGDHPMPLWDALDVAIQEEVPGIDPEEQPQVLFAAEFLVDLHRLAGRVTIAELLRLALEQTGYLATLTALPDGARRRGNVEKLIDKAEQSGKITLGAFSQYLDDLSERETREGEALIEANQSVTLMTVHKSKGLEFPVVVLVDCSWEKGNFSRGLLLHDPDYGLSCKVLDVAQNKHVPPYMHRRADRLRQRREEAERKRLLYVAATRAQDYLLVGGQVTQNRDGLWNATGWLNLLLDAFDLRDMTREAQRDLDYGWGHVRIGFAPPERASASGADGSARATAWDMPPVRDGQSVPGVDAAAPPLMAAPSFERDAPARSLTATQIGDLGGLRLPEDGQFYRRKLRHSLFYDSPSTVEMVTKRGSYVSRRKLGEMVHKALKWWRFPTDEGDLEAMLRGYAWEQGIVNPRQIDEAVSAARDLLKKLLSSEVYQWITSAAAVYREVPFVYQAAERTIYGVIDVLFQRADGSWALIDYKTSVVHDADDNPAAVADHAARYHLQLGVYAAAVRQQLQDMTGADLVPDVYIHYIGHGMTIPIPTPTWEAALVQLEDHVGDLVLHPAQSR